VAKKRVGRYLNEFRRMCVEQMKQCDDIVALAAELDIHRRLLYRWRDQLEPVDKSELSLEPLICRSGNLMVPIASGN
jgi:transposase-like protein